MSRPAYLPPHLAIWPRRLPRELVLPQTTLWFNLEVTAARYPDKDAYLFFGQALTFAQLKRRAEALAGWLQGVGVAKGDRVMLLMQNCPQFVEAFYGVMRADAVVVPVNPMNKADELTHYLSDPDTKVVICAADLAGQVAAAIEAVPAERRPAAVLVARYADALPPTIPAGLRPSDALLQWLQADPPLPAGFARWGDALGAGRVATPPQATADDLALLPYTSGTTGLPKGCMHTHRTLMANVVGSGAWGHTGAETVALAVVPMFHITGMMYGVLSPVYGGATSVVMPRWDRELAARLIAAHRVSHWTCIPTMVIDLFASPNVASFDLGSLRFMNGGGAAMPKAIAEKLEAQFGLVFAEGYGLTETAAPSHANPPERAKLQCLGIPMFGVDARIVDPVSFEPVPIGEVGEIVTHGPMVFQGYWKHPEATATSFIEIDGKRFFRTGDLARMDEEGYFFIVDRLKRMINASGFKVWPSEVELMLYKHPAVAEACVIGTLDAYRGESVKAVVVLRAEARGSTTGEDIMAWAREHMAAYKVPRAVEFVEALPKSGTGKVMWRALQEAERQRAAAG